MARWRKFLQPAKDNVDSYVAVDINTDGYHDLKIADCNRSVTLSFTVTNEKNRKTAQKKLAALQQALDKLGTVINGPQ